ncbi:hypothetical protein [Luedemannella helvata]|uniref:Uncharacterized protein n=1 Tax=Luedemannella helvata TaxID=349315 RepID=A0ABN2JYK5_9ACTN
MSGCGSDGEPAAVWSPATGATASPPVAPSSAPPGPDASFTLAKLGEQTLPILNWGEDCPTKTLRFRGGRASTGGYQITIRQAIASDVDGDGRRETVALLHCQRRSDCAVIAQVAVVDRDAAGKVFMSLQVVAMQRQIQSIERIRVPRAGVVEARVAEYSGCELPGVQVHHWRAYRYVTSTTPYMAFAPSGPTQFPPNPLVVDLAAALTAGKAGALKVTISNKSTVAATRVWVFIWVRNARTISAGSGLHSCTGGTSTTNPADYLLWCRTADVKAGGTITVSAKASLRSGDGDPVVSVNRYPPGLAPWAKGARSYPDPVSGNNGNLPGFGG